MSYDTVRFISRQRSELAASQNLWRQKVEFFFKWRNSGHFCVQKTFWNWTLCSCQNVLLFLINLSGLGLVLWMTRWKQHYILTPEKKRLINLICLPRHFWLTREEDVGSRLEEVQLYKILDSWALLLRHIQRMRTYLVMLFWLIVGEIGKQRTWSLYQCCGIFTTNKVSGISHFEVVR